jgi:hypothetical protein
MKRKPIGLAAYFDTFLVVSAGSFASVAAGCQASSYIRKQKFSLASPATPRRYRAHHSRSAELLRLLLHTPPKFLSGPKSTMRLEISPGAPYFSLNGPSVNTYAAHPPEDAPPRKISGERSPRCCHLAEIQRR